MKVKARLLQLWDGGSLDTPVRKQDLLDLAAIVDDELAKREASREAAKAAKASGQTFASSREY